MASAFQSNAFQNDAFQTDAAPVVEEIDVFVDDERQRKRDREFRERNERLRADILYAIDGPQAEEVEAALAPYIEGPVSAPVSIDYDAIARRAETVLLIRRAVEAAEQEHEDDLLLSA